MGRSWLFLEGVDPDEGRDHRDHRQEEDELDPYRQPHEPPGPAGPRAASLAVGCARDQLLATVVTRGLDVVPPIEYATSPVAARGFRPRPLNPRGGVLGAVHPFRTEPEKGRFR